MYTSNLCVFVVVVVVVCVYVCMCVHVDMCHVACIHAVVFSVTTSPYVSMCIASAIGISLSKSI